VIRIVSLIAAMLAAVTSTIDEGRSAERSLADRLRSLL